MPPLHIAYAVLVAMIWGFNFVAIKIGLESFPPLLFTALRFALASLPFLPFLKPPKVGIGMIIAIGTFMGTLQFGLLFVGMDMGMSPGISSVVIQTQAFFTVLFAVMALKERPRLQNLAGLGLAFIGVIVIAGHLGNTPLVPFLMVIAAGASWGVANILMRKAGSDDPARLIIWACAVPPLPLLAASWLWEGSARIAAVPEHVTWLAVISLAFIAFVGTNVAWGLWSLMLRQHRAAAVAPFALLVPFFGISSSWLVLGDQLSIAKLGGAALIIAGVAANSWPTRRTKTAETLKVSS